MAIGTAAAIAMGGGALLGGIAGSQSDEASQWSDWAPESALEKAAREGSLTDYNALRDLIGRGPGSSDVDAGYGAQKDLAAMFQQYSQGGYMPTAGDISSSNDVATKLFGAQRVGMNQAFGDQLTQANRQAALMGRDMNDPILRAKLAQEQTRQSALLDANQGAFAQQYALNQPMQRLQFAQGRADILGGLASQAMANRQALLGMGQNIMTLERNTRQATATQHSESGGGLKGAITGGLAGAGMGMGMASGFAGMGGLGGAAPAASAPIGPMMQGGSFLSGGSIGPRMASGNFLSGGQPFANQAAAPGGDWMGRQAGRMNNMFGGY